MIHKLLAILVCLLLLASPTSASALSIETLPNTSGLIISEIYPDAIASDTDDENGEFIELHNTTNAPMDLKDQGFSLHISTTGSSTKYAVSLSHITLEPGEYRALRDVSGDTVTFSLSNTSATVELRQTVAAEITPLASILYSAGDVDKNFSLSLINDSWQLATPSPNVANPVPPAPKPEPEPEQPPVEEPPIIEPPVEGPTPEEPPTEQPPVEEPVPETPPTEQPACTATNVFINEILANPSGVDADGGEFVELYNAGGEPASLTKCLLTTDKITEYELENVTVEPGAYYVVQLTDKLLNGGGSVTFISAAKEEIINYPALSDNEAWAFIDNVWQVTELGTPGSTNLPTPPVPANEPESENEATPEPCPAGKFRNPETNRCKTIAQDSTVLAACLAGETRNPLTNRCRKTTNLATALTTCQVGQERNPLTNRCRKTVSAAATSALAPCQEGYERNTDTNRCRKVSGATGTVAGAATFPVSGPAPLHPAILISMTLAALGYGAYEYRYDLANLRHRLRNLRSKTKVL